MNTAKTKRLNVRLSDAEYSAIATNASAAGIGVSEYVRCRALRQTDIPAIIVDSEALKNMYRDLRRAGGNVNQIARELNTRHCPDQLEAEILAALSSIERASRDVSCFIETARQSF